MNYVTAIYLPSSNWDGKCEEWVPRFAVRSLEKIHLGVQEFVPALERSQAILGNSMLFILDSNLRSHPNGKIVYDALLKAQLHVQEVTLKPRGIYSNKWACMLASFASRSGPTIWMDATDSEAIEPLSEEEDKFISEKAVKAGIVVEWEQGPRCFGPRMSNSDGTIASKKPKQTQLSIYCLPDGSIAEACYKMDMDYDQIAATHHFQNTRGWFQDAINEGVVSSTTSEGLFRVEGKGYEHRLIFRKEPARFKEKLIHKPDWHKTY